MTIHNFIDRAKNQRNPIFWRDSGRFYAIIRYDPAKCSRKIVIVFFQKYYIINND